MMSNSNKLRDFSLKPPHTPQVFRSYFFWKIKSSSIFSPSLKNPLVFNTPNDSEQELRGWDNKCVMRAPYVPKSHLHNTLWSSSVCENGSIPFKWIFSRLCIRNKLVSFCQVNYLYTANVNLHFQDLVGLFGSGCWTSPGVLFPRDWLGQ